MLTTVTQQINLYQPILHRQKIVLSFDALLRGVGTVSCAMLLLFAWGLLQTHSLSGDLSLLQSQLNSQHQLLTTVNGQLSNQDKESHLRRELAQLEQQQLSRRQIISTLNDMGQDYRSGVTGFMEVLSHGVPKGLWLKTFSVGAGGKDIIIKGQAQRPELIPDFIDRLSREPSLSGIHFGMLQIDRRSDRGKAVQFVLYTGTEAPDEDG